MKCSGHTWGFQHISGRKNPEKYYYCPWRWEEALKRQQNLREQPLLRGGQKKLHRRRNHQVLPWDRHGADSKECVLWMIVLVFQRKTDFFHVKEHSNWWSDMKPSVKSVFAILYIHLSAKSPPSRKPQVYLKIKHYKTKILFSFQPVNPQCSRSL